MNPLEQKPGPKWWKETPGYKTYYLREFSGILIFIWCVYFLGTFMGFNIPNSYYHYGINIVGLLGAVIHSSTWIGIMPQLTPLNLNKSQQTAIYLLLLFLWLGVSALTLLYLWK